MVLLLNTTACAERAYLPPLLIVKIVKNTV